MKIYTKSGDQGKTTLWGGKQVSKNHQRIQVYGTLDEANSVLGIAISLLTAPTQKLKNELQVIQNQLFDIGSELASPDSQNLSSMYVEGEEISKLEAMIDTHTQSLKPLQNFILPGGSQLAATLHLVRTIIRRTERELVTLMQTESVRSDVLIYLNRLSDYFFSLARYANSLEGISELEWAKKSKL